MKTRTFQIHVLPFIIFVFALLLLWMAWLRSESVESIYLGRIQNDMLIRSSLLVPEVRKFLESKPESGAFHKFVEDLSHKADARITIISSDGTVLGDSSEDRELPNHGNRDEIKQALQQGSGYSVRYSSTLRQRMLYAAVPVSLLGGEEVILRLAVSIKSIDDVLESARNDIILAGAIVAVVMAFLTYIIARYISRPVEKIKNNAARIAAGELDVRIPETGRGAIRELVLCLNAMADQLRSKLDMITYEKNQRDAILSSMTEGVIATDLTGDIISINEAAARFFGLKNSGGSKKSVFGIIRNPELQEFFDRILYEQRTFDEEFMVYDDENRYMQIRGTVLKSQNNQVIGVLLVISDVTQIRKLENFRRDFVADVSHEIKTPLTVIRGAVETLEDGALDNKESARKFMHIITKHTDRLNALVADILSLSALEQKGPWSSDFSNFEVSVPVGSAIDFCREKADKKKVQVRIEHMDECEIHGDCQLLEQAVVNLIDNAVKYSNPESSVIVRTDIDGQEVVISVRDFGCGIPEEHQPRLFERFYRVDKARSRKLGGTGLGLSIVKHITQMHNGSVSVESEMGVGSTFRIRIPIEKAL